MSVHQRFTSPSDEDGMAPRMRRWLFRRHRFATREQEGRLDCGTLSMIASTSSWGIESMVRQGSPGKIRGQTRGRTGRDSEELGGTNEVKRGGKNRSL